MISGQGRDLTGPRFDRSNRVSKPSNPTPSSKAKQQYLNEDEQSKQFMAGEDKFVMKQSKKKADKRVREGRAEPIDLLAFNLRYIDTVDRDFFDGQEADAEIDVPKPEEVIEGLGAAQLQQLGSDITNFHTLEANTRNREYWKALQTICNERRKRLEKQGGGSEEQRFASVSENVDNILRPKTFEQLEELERQIMAKLNSDEEIDEDFWENLLRGLPVWKARAKLKNIYKEIKEARLEQLKKINPEKAATLAESDGFLSTSQPVVPAPLVKPDARDTVVKASSSREDGNAPPPGTARFAQAGNEDYSQATKALYDREVARGVGENEEIFTAEESVATGLLPKWADKYRPRKPRYFNRVQMGYEWNKYNQTHYDQDNPPPKVVHGYRFNVFYPDLIDTTKAPTYKIVREHGRKRGESFVRAGEEDTCLIRFIAGPPYEDIAFRIVDKEWDYSAKRDRGFRSSFDKVRHTSSL
jgi:hypothetical protein